MWADFLLFFFSHEHHQRMAILCGFWGVVFIFIRPYLTEHVGTVAVGGFIACAVAMIPFLSTTRKDAMKWFKINDENKIIPMTQHRLKLQLMFCVMAVFIQGDWLYRSVFFVVSQLFAYALCTAGGVNEEEEAEKKWFEKTFTKEERELMNTNMFTEYALQQLKLKKYEDVQALYRKLQQNNCTFFRNSWCGVSIKKE